MTRLLAVLVLAMALADAPARAQSADDHELRTNQRLHETARTAADRFAAAMNLGDIHAGRGGREEARRWWSRARSVAAEERERLRSSGNLSGSARFSAWEAVAASALGDRAEAIALFEQARRILPGDAALLGRYANAELSHGAAEHAVNLARAALAHSALPGGDRTLLDYATIEYTLARALAAAGDAPASASRARAMIERLEGPAARSLRERAAAREEFTVIGTARGDAEALTTLLVRGHLHLATHEERAGNRQAALEHARRALLVRSDQPEALALVARIRGESSDWLQAFSSSPLDRQLHLQYRSALRAGLPPLDPAGDSLAALAMKSVEAIEQRRWSTAAILIDQMKRRSGAQDALLALEAESLAGQGRAAEARDLIARIRSRSLAQGIDIPHAPASGAVELPADGSRLYALELERIEALLVSPASAAGLIPQLEERTYESLVILENPAVQGGVTAATGAVVHGGDNLTLRFMSPVRFRGDFSGETVILTYSILAADHEGLVVEPSGVRLP